MQPEQSEKLTAPLIKYAEVFNSILILIGLYAASTYHFLLFHTLAELFSIVVAMAIFMLAWNCRKFAASSYLSLLGIAFLFIGGLDLVHALAYKGMNIFPGYDSNLPTQLWIAARYMEALSFLAVPLLLKRKLSTGFAFTSYLTVTIGLLITVFTNTFPDCFIEGSGLTVFKKSSEYIISLILFSSMGLLARKRWGYDPTVFRLLVLSIVFTIFSELAFTFYVSVYGLSNLVGHFLKIISFYMIYKAIIVTGLENPYSIMFKDLKESRDAFQASEKKYRTLIENLNEGVWVIDQEANTTFVNPRMAEMLGYSVEEMHGKHLFAFMDDQGIELAKHNLERCQQGIKEQHEFEFLRKDDTRIYAMLETSPLTDDDGNYVGALAGVIDITERKQAEEQLKTNEENYRELVEKAKTAILKIDKTGRITFMNEYAEALFEYKKKEIMGKHVIGTIVPEIDSAGRDLTQMFDIFFEQMGAHYDSFVENENITKSGKKLWVSWSNIPILDANSQITGMISVGHDITERKQLEAEIQQQKDFLENAIESLNHPFYVVDAGTYRVLIANKAAAPNGLTETDTCYSLTHNRTEPCNTAEHPCPVKLVKKTQKAATVEHIHYDPDGNPRNIEAHAHPVFDEEGNVVQVIEYILDITDRKQAEDAMRESEERLRTLINSVPDLICFKDGEGRWLIANDAYLELFQLKNMDYAGKKYSELAQFSPLLSETCMVCEATDEQSWQVVGPSRGEEIIPNPDGQPLTYDVIKVPMLNPDGSRCGLIVFGRDVTERKQLEDKLKAAKETADEANRMKSEFLANMSHEIRTPMNAVLGFAEILSNEITDTKHKNYLESIRVSGSSLLTLINDILDLSKIEAGKFKLKPEPVDPHSIFTEIKQIFTLKIADKNLAYLEDISENIPRFMCLDSLRLRQTLLNLVGNAVKFTAKGHVKLAADLVEHQPDKPRADLIITVEDTGVGIPEKEQRRIFSPFQQQDQQSAREFGGTGLGLTITKRLVEMMNGDIQVTSQPGMGSTFKVILRNVHLVEEQNILAESTENFPVDYERLIFEPANILITDDLSSNRLLIKAMLKETQLTVIEAKNGQEAIEHISQHLPDLVLMDIRMPVMDGYQAADKIKNDLGYKDLPIIVLTAAAMDDEKEKALAFGFDEFLSKPFQAADLLTILSKYLKHTHQELAEETIVEEEIEVLSPETLAHLPEILKKLEGEYMSSWKKVRASNDFTEITRFAEHLGQFGEKWGLTGVVSYGSALKEYCDTFNVDDISNTLEKYPDIIDHLEQLE